jgi:ATP-binding cassette, sub-family E, member 1
MRIAIVDDELCRPNKCQQECVRACPINRAGDKCLYIEKKAVIDEDLCTGCGLCVKKCPYQAVMIINTPEKLKENPMHRFGNNGFVLFRLPFPSKGVVGLLGPNGVGKTTALRILSGEIKPNLGKKETVELNELVKIFRGTELQDYLSNLENGELKTVVKPQKVDVLVSVKGTVDDLLNKYNERGKKDEIVKELSLGTVLDRGLSKLSGGELQRVAIAIAVSRKADIYYIDEPSSYLDVFQRLKVAQLLRKLSEEKSVMVVEHDLATLDLLADKIHIFYGVPGGYGVVTKNYSTRVGINTFLDGYIKEDNVRTRKDAIDFSVAKLQTVASQESIIEWSEIKKKLGEFSLVVDKGDLKKGEILGIFGSNALGKTTFAKILAGEIKADGEITKEVTISYKPQYISDHKGTVIDYLQGLADSWDDFRTEVIDPLGLARLMECRFETLSGGELQRVMIAGCFAKNVDIYLLDEPSAYLDSEQRILVAKMIRKICERREASAMVIDHDLLFLDYLSDRALVFSGESGLRGKAKQMPLQDGFNCFLKEVSITFRTEPHTKRPRANKPGSQKDKEQRAKGKWFV